MFNWNRTQTDYLRSLNARRDWNGNRKQYVRNIDRFGNARYLSHRQYVIARFRKHFDIDSVLLSDQAIWAKYNRTNGNAAKKAAVVNRRVVAKVFSSDSVTLTPGMDMDDWTDLGVTYLGRGATRKVYALGTDYVLKVAYNRDRGYLNGVQSNKRELATWIKVTAADEKHFAHIVAADPLGSWVIQERVNPSTNKSTAAAARVARSYNVSDLHGGNFGERADGTPVVLDYASA